MDNDSTNTNSFKDFVKDGFGHEYNLDDDYNLVIGRGILILIVCLLGILIFKGSRKAIPQVLRKTITNDFFYPVLVLFSLFLIEAITSLYCNKPQIKSEHWNFFLYMVVAITGFTIIQKTVTRFINETLYIIIQILLIVFLYRAFHKDGMFHVYHFFYELLPITLTFIIYFLRDTHLEYKKENKEERKFWTDYTDTLSNVKSKIVAINTEKYSEFTDPLGFRYFNEQLNFLVDSRSTNSTIVLKNIEKKRFFIVSSIKDNLKDSPEIISLKTENNLNDNQRTFKSLNHLHKIFNIEMYLIPIDEVKILVYSNLTRYPKIIYFFYVKNILKNIDRLIIDNTLYKPKEKNRKLIFEKNESNKEIIEKIITKFSHNDYNVEELKK